METKTKRDLLVFATVFFLACTIIGIFVHTRASLIAAGVNFGLFVWMLYMLRPHFQDKKVI